MAATETETIDIGQLNFESCSNECQPGFISITADCLDAGTCGLITQLPENSLLAHLGIRCGKNLQMVTRQRFGGPVVVEVDGHVIALSRTLCQGIKLSFACK